MEAFRVHILGCGSALPTLRHYSAMQVVECRGKLFMVDCGEGAQIQLRRSGLAFNKLGHIFISHLHGDHCFGLIGLISSFALLGRTARLRIYAPEELKPMLSAQLQLFCTHLDYEIEFHAVCTTSHAVIYEDRSLCIETLPLNHRMPCCGYLFREKSGLPHIRREKIDFYNIPLAEINNIKAGKGYTLPDGTYVAHEQLVVPADKPRSYAYCSDTAYMPHLHELLKGVTTLYHESTYGEDNLQMAQKYYHSTARQAATVAAQAGVGQLLLGHYSRRYQDEQVLLREALEVFPNARLSHEMDVIDV